MVPRALSEGRSREDIIADLMRLDWSRPAAAALVDRVANDLKRFHESPESRRGLVAEARRQIAAGLALALLGLGITAFTFLAALVGALGFYVIAWGLVFVGAIVFVRGWN